MAQRTILFLLFYIFALASSAQRSVTKSVMEFGAKGDGRTDDQFAFEKAADFFNKRGGNGRLVIPPGVYIVGRQELNADQKHRNVLNLHKVKNLVIEGQKAKVRFRSGLFFGAFHPKTRMPFHSKERVFTDYPYAVQIGSFIHLADCSNIIVRGIEVDGNQDGMKLGGKFGDDGFQLIHDGVFIENSSNILMENLYIHHMGRDGMQISNKTPKQWATPDQKIEINNSTFEYNGRQGLSWVGGSGLKVKNSKFNFTGRGRISSAPGAGVDIEAEVGIIQNGIFENCEFVDNAGCGMVADSGESRDMQFNNCTFWGTTSWSMWTIKPNYTFFKSRFHGSIVHAHNADNDKDATKFIHCVFEDKSLDKKPAFGRFLLEINFRKRVMFDECTFISNTKKIWWFDGDPGWKDNEKPLMKNARIIAKMTNFPVGDYISVKNCLREAGSVYELYYPKNKNYYETGSGNVDLGGNRLVWKN